MVNEVTDPMRTGYLVPLVAIAFASTAWPQGDPLGAEFRVNTYTTNSQRFPSVAADPSGGTGAKQRMNFEDGRG